MVETKAYRWFAIALVLDVAAVTLAAGCDTLKDELEGDDDDVPGGGSGRVPSLYAAAPDVAACVPGQLSAEAQNNVIAYWNGIRARHGLPAVEASPADAPRMQAAALIRLANAGSGSYDVHHPTTAQACHSADGAKAAAEANLFLSAGNQVGVIGDPARYIDEWLIDKGVGNLGHRRFLLDPFLKKTAFGLVDGTPHMPLPFSPVVAAALQVVHPEENTIAPTLEFVAYPFGAYPAKQFDVTQPHHRGRPGRAYPA